MNECTYDGKVPFFLIKVHRLVDLKELENIQANIANMKMNAIL